MRRDMAGRATVPPPAPGGAGRRSRRAPGPHQHGRGVPRGEPGARAGQAGAPRAAPGPPADHRRAAHRPARRVRGRPRGADQLARGPRRAAGRRRHRPGREFRAAELLPQPRRAHPGGRQRRRHRRPAGGRLDRGLPHVAGGGGPGRARPDADTPARGPGAGPARRLDPVTGMAAPGAGQPAPDRASGWQVVTATERGAAHRAAGIPNQDAVAAIPLENGGMVTAVADGHGHSRHFRSARGARLAVSIACGAARDLATRPGGLPGPGREEELRRVLVPGIVARWRDAVLADVAAEPFTGPENAVRRGDDVTIPYGTTLLLAIGQGQRLLLAQIGDGDIVGIGPDGTALLPVPGDPTLDGRHTTSLCSPRAAGSFRVAAAGLAATPLLGVLLATDGYGNAQVARAWEAVVSADLAGLIPAHPASWLASKLPEWAGRCASLDGSADDTTLALLLAPAAASALEPGASGP